MVSIIVCTRNRVDVLKECLPSILNLDPVSCPFEVLVVDNASTDDTGVYVKSQMQKCSNLRYIIESTIGLSYARNRGAADAVFPYVAYIDDDGKVQKDFLELTCSVIKNHSFDFFGGWYIPWYKSAKPKWVPDSIGYYPKWSEEISVLKPDQDIPGCIMIMKKSALNAIGGFPAEMGMRGDVVGYGEETWVQLRLRQEGFLLGFVPGLVLEHLVAEYKCKLSWHLNRQFAMTRDKQVMKGFLSPFGILKGFMKVLLYPVPLFIYNSRKLLDKDYYWQNWVLDSLTFPLRTLGSIASSLSRR